VIALLYIVAQSVYATMYSTGPISTPDCLPTDSTSTCGVRFPEISGNINFTNSNKDIYIGYGVGTTSGAGIQNVFIGYPASSINVGSAADVGIGASALKDTAGSGVNTAIGDSALAANTDDYSTAVGANALKSYYFTAYEEHALGANALMNETTGQRDAAFGKDAMMHLTTGIYNSAIGYKSGFNITTGNNNTLLGYSTGNSIVTGSSNIIIGANQDTPGDVSNFLNIGGTIYGNLSTKKIGIGTTTPAESLDIVGDMYIENGSGIIMKDASSSSCYITNITNGVIVSTAHACN